MLKKLFLLMFVVALTSAVAAFASPEEELVFEDPSVADSAIEDVVIEDLDENDHPIDKEVHRLLELDESTNGQVQAFAKGYDLWDAELNKVYKELMTAYGSNESLKSALKEAQLAWLKFRDAEFKHLAEVCTSKDGSMYRMFLASDRMEFIKSRALELKSRFDSFTESN